MQARRELGVDAGWLGRAPEEVPGRQVLLEQGSVSISVRTCDLSIICTRDKVAEAGRTILWCTPFRAQNRVPLREHGLVRGRRAKMNTNTSPSCESSAMESFSGKEA